jgi:hypothetical protein
MKKILLIHFMFLSFFCYGQNDIEVYSADILYMVAWQSENNEIISKKPFGRNVEVKVNRVFKSIVITFYTEDNEPSIIRFSYIQDVKKIDAWRMNTNGANCVIYNYLPEYGKLIMMYEKLYENGTIVGLLVENAIKKN